MVTLVIVSLTWLDAASRDREVAMLTSVNFVYYMLYKGNN